MIFNRNTLCNILALHQTNLDRKAIDPIFSSILININQEVLEITSTDSQRFLKVSSYINHQSNASFLINGSLLYDIIKKSKNENLEIKEDENNYTIIIDNAEFKIAKHNNENEYKKSIQWEENNNNQKLTISAHILHDGLKLIKWAVSTDMSRLSLTGICFDINENELTLCATDTLKLATIKLNCRTNITGKWILNKKSITDLIHILNECESQEIQLEFDKYFSLFYQKNQNQIIWKSLFLLGDYPPYQKVLQIKNMTTTSFEIDLDIFNKIIDRIMIASNQNYPIITFNFSEEQSIILSENSILSGMDILPIKYQGPNLKISFNGKFLQEMISNLTNRIKISIKDSLSPIVINSTTNEHLICIIAPIHMNQTN